MKKRLLIVLAFVCAIWFVYSAYRGFTETETGELLARVDWLPEEATNVSFYRSYLNTAYEFDISERRFREWSRWKLEEIVDPVHVPRYLAFSTPIPQEPDNASNAEMDALAMEYAKRGVTIRDGLYYRYMQDNGGGVWVSYDRRSGRGYFYAAPR